MFAIFGYSSSAPREPESNMDGSYMLLSSKKTEAPDAKRLEAGNKIIRAADGDVVVETAGVCSICLQVVDEKEEAKASGWSLLGRGSQKQSAVRSLQPCGHKFHTACIDQWLCACVEVNSGRCIGRSGLLQKLSCPNCRRCPELDEKTCDEIFPNNSLEKLDATFNVSPANEYLYEIVRRIEQANETRDPTTGKIRFFRPEDGFLTRVSKMGMYAVLIVPATVFYLFRAVILPNLMNSVQASVHYSKVVNNFVREQGFIISEFMKRGAIYSKDLTVRGLKLGWTGVTTATEMCYRWGCMPIYEYVLLPGVRGAQKCILTPMQKCATYFFDKIRSCALQLGKFLDRVVVKSVFEKFMRPWGLTMWNRVRNAFGSIVRYTTQSVMKFGVYLLEVGFVIRDVLKTGIRKLRNAGCYVGDRIIGATSVVLNPAWRICKLSFGRVWGAIKGYSQSVLKGCHAVYDGIMRPAIVKLVKALRAATDIFYASIVQPIDRNIMRPLMAFIRVGVGAVMDILRQISSVVAQGARAYFDALRAVYQDFAKVLRQLYISLSRTFARKQK
jgi:hypothetical protein